MNTINFEEPIAIELNVTKIALVETLIGPSVYIEGTFIKSDMQLKDNNVCFYCPEPLKHLLKQINLKKGDIISLRYLGRIRRKGTQIRDFFVEKISEKKDLRYSSDPQPKTNF